MRDGEQLTAEKIKSYLLVLADLPVEMLERGLKRCAKECVFFPTAAEIREKTSNFNLAAEQSWELVQRVISHHWHPDIGFYPDAPKFDVATEYALRQCKGLRRISEAADDQFPFVRRDFLEAFERFQQEGGEQTHFSRQLAETTFRKLVAARKEEENQ